MIATLLPIVIQPPVSTQPRTPGIHVSRVLRNLAVKNGALKKEWVNAEDLGLIEAGNEGWWKSLDATTQLKMSMGLAWEEWYGPRLDGVIYHPGEMELDGIFMTHDGESLDVVRHAMMHGLRHELAVHEFKLTYKSTKTVGNLETQWLFKAQVKAYCKGIGALVAYLHILFVCGNYKFPLTPQLKVWRIEFEQWELDQQWDEIIDEVALHQALEDIGAEVIE